MEPRTWQRSSYCGEGNSCVNVAAAADGTLRLRESEIPDIILTVAPAALRALIQSVKTDDGDHVRTFLQ